MATAAEIRALKEQLLEGLHILIAEGVLNAMGHLSVRVPDTETYLINPRYAPNLAGIDDLCTVDLSGRRIDGPGPIPGESHIHTAIYNRHPTATTALHCHPRFCVLFGLLDVPLVPFNNEAMPFSQGIPVYPHSHQIDTVERGRALAEVIGDGFVAFQRGHGIAAAGLSIAGIVRMAIRLERVCEDQLTLMRVTTPQPLADSDQPTNAGLRADYREWPFLQQKHGTRPTADIKASLPLPVEGERSADRRTREGRSA